MGYKQGPDRSQPTMFPEVLDDYVEARSYVRFLDEFVDSFDLVALGFTHAVAAETGRPPYHPGDLLKLYLYGSINRLNSTRQLAWACKNSVEAMWLLRKLQPDFRTICGFRKSNGKALRRLFREFIRRLKAMGVVTGEMIAVDGTKFAGANSKDNNYSVKRLQRLVRHYDERIKGYLSRLDKNDLAEETTPELKQQIELMQERRKEKEALLLRLQQQKEKQISTTDPDSRRMKSGDGTVVGYNVQSTVDAQNKIIIDVEVTNSGNDSHELEKMGNRAKEILEQDAVKMAADSGYYRSEEIVNCEKNGIETYVSKPKSRKTKFFSKTDFVYDKQQNHYTCPAGEQLTCKGKIREHGRWLWRYETVACKNCSLRTHCTGRKKGNRRITRFIDEDLLEKIQERVNQSPDIRTRRKAIVEHPFATLKRRTGGRFLTRGLFNVATEAVLMVLAYDLTRLFNRLGENFTDKMRLLSKFIFNSTRQISFRPSLFCHEVLLHKNPPFFA
jgi:transposase